MNAFQHILIFGVRLYRWVVSPAIVLLCGPLARCRFTPSCSQYALEALRTHGALRGSGLTLRRLCRCHPWGGCGDDPIPARRQVTAGIMPAEKGGILPPRAALEASGARTVRIVIPPGGMPSSTAQGA